MLGSKQRDFGQHVLCRTDEISHNHCSLQAPTMVAFITIIITIIIIIIITCPGSDESVVILATLVALLDVFFIVLFVPESLLSEQKMAIKSLTFKQVEI